MKLPNARLALVQQEKITGYLLNTEHLYGASKARFFVGFGFRQEVWEELAAALKEHGQRHEVASVRETEFGVRYAVDGVLRAPDNRQPRVRTIWQIDDGEIAPRLITAHPLEA